VESAGEELVEEAASPRLRTDPDLAAAAAEEIKLDLPFDEPWVPPPADDLRDILAQLEDEGGQPPPAKKKKKDAAPDSQEGGPAGGKGGKGKAKGKGG
jgi:hypothetical protein